jgi:ribonuclease D
VRLWIEDPKELSARLADAPPRVDMDTEFVRERTWWPKLALVQLAVGKDILLADPLAPGIADALAPLLADASVLKVMHSASEDLVALKRGCGVVPAPLFDTQVAAALAGIGAGMGYQRLVQDITGNALAKGETRSDWLRRPLSPSQLEYAADDVVHLAALNAELEARLRALGRLDWLAEDCARMVSGARDDALDRWPHLAMRAAQYMDPASQARLLRLLRWRDAYARDHDRQRGWIIDNDLAANLARHPPAARAALQRQLEATPKAPRNLGDAIWSALQTPLPDESDAPQVRNDERDKTRLRGLQAAVSELAGELGMAEGVLASKRWLQSLLDRRARGEDRWPSALAGWRRPLLEPRLAPLLDGELQ